MSIGAFLNLFKTIEGAMFVLRCDYVCYNFVVFGVNFLGTRACFWTALGLVFRTLRVVSDFSDKLITNVSLFKKFVLHYFSFVQDGIIFGYYRSGRLVQNAFILWVIVLRAWNGIRP